jgi:GntR family transcriptional regulator
MLIVVDPHSGVPVYKQIMDQVKFHVASGLLKQGDNLPSTRKLSADLGVNPMTISKAYSYLEHEGIVERRPGRKLVVSSREEDAVLRERKDRLAEHLGPIVTIARQLGLTPDDALKVFEDLIRSEIADNEDDQGRP